MTAESNVGARLLLIGKDGVLAGLREITAATARLNAEIAAGGKASKVAAAGQAEQAGVTAAQLARMKVYEAQLGRVNVETNALARVGKVAFMTMAVAGAAWTYESIKWAQNYQTELVRLRTQAGLTVGAMNAIGRAAMANSAGLGTTPTAYLQAAYHPASTGFGTAQSIAITNYAAKVSAISGAPLEDTANAITGVMKAYGFGKGQTGHTTALLNAVVGAGNMRFADLNAALGSGVASSGKTFGVGLTSLGGALAYLTDRGVPAAQAGTRLRMAVSLLGAPSAEASKFLTDAGLGQTQAKDASNQMAQTLQAAGLTTTQMSSALRNNSGAGGIYNALELLHKSLAGSGMSTEMQSAFISRSFGGGRMGASIMALYNNLPGLSQKSTQIDKNATNKKFMDDWSATTKTLNFQLHSLGGELETIGTQFGTKVLPWVSKGVGVFTDLLKVLDKNRALAITLASVVTAVLVPAIGLYLYRALLSSGGAIRSVIGAYSRLIFGQTEEQLALQRTNIVLGEQTVLTGRLAGEDLALAGASSTAAGRAGGLAGAGRGIGGKLLGAASLAGGGYLAGSLIRGNSGSTVSSHQTNSQNIRSVLGDMVEGGGIGAGLGSVIPGVGTVIGGAVGTAAGGIYGERHQIGSALKTGWDDLFGGGSSGTSVPTGRSRLHVVAHVYIDGKEVKNATVKYTKAQAARK